MILLFKCFNNILRQKNMDAHSAHIQDTCRMYEILLLMVYTLLLLTAACFHVFTWLVNDHLSYDAKLFSQKQNVIHFLIFFFFLSVEQVSSKVVFEKIPMVLKLLERAISFWCFAQSEYHGH